jgi:hypothetical protein
MPRYRVWAFHRQSISHHRAVGKPGGIDAQTIDRCAMGEVIEEHCAEAYVVNLVVHRVAAASARVEGVKLAQYSAAAVGIDGDEAEAVGGEIHVRIVAMARGITAAAVEIEHDRELAAARGLRRDMNQIIAGAILVLEREAVIAGRERGGLRGARLAIRSAKDKEDRDRRHQCCAQTCPHFWPPPSHCLELSHISRRPRTR